MSTGAGSGKGTNTAGRRKTSTQAQYSSLQKKKFRNYHDQPYPCTLIQVVTGQNNLNYLLSKILPDHTDQCRFCKESEETFVHECPVFLELRQAHLNGSEVVDTVDWDPRVLLQFAYHPQIAEALNERYTTTR